MVIVKCDLCGKQTKNGLETIQVSNGEPVSYKPRRLLFVGANQNVRWRIQIDLNIVKVETINGIGVLQETLIDHACWKCVKGFIGYKSTY